MARRLLPSAALLLIAAGSLVGRHAALAAETEDVTDSGGVLRVAAPAAWRAQPSATGFTATGFLGVKRCELFGEIFPAAAGAADAATKWKQRRTAERPAVQFLPSPADPLRWIAYDAPAGVVDYVRSLEGAGTQAVVWLRMNGSPGPNDAPAYELLATARLEKPAPKPAGPTGAEKAPEPESPAVEKFKDRAFAVELTVPKGFTERKDLPASVHSERRVLALEGPLGADAKAFLDLYAFPDFDRADAVTWWWAEAERRGWADGVAVEAAPPALRVIPAGTTWTRLVRVIDTAAGFHALKLDIDTTAEAAGRDLLDRLATNGLTVLKPRLPDDGPPPAGVTALDGPTHRVLHEGDPAEATALLRDAATVDAIVTELLGPDAVPTRRGILRVHKDQLGLDAAAKAQGGPAGVAAWWAAGRREVLTRAGVATSRDTQSELWRELARDSIQRRLGFPGPWWLETGVALVAASAPINKGRTDLPHPALVEKARNAATGTIEFEIVRWWPHETSRGIAEREAIAWGFVFLIAERGPLADKWDDSLRAYVKRLRETGNPAEATKAYDFAREAEMVEDWKKRMRKL